MYFSPMYPFIVFSRASLYFARGTILCSGGMNFLAWTNDARFWSIFDRDSRVFSAFHRVIQKPFNRMSLKMRWEVGTITGWRDMPPYVTNVREGSVGGSE